MSLKRKATETCSPAASKKSKLGSTAGEAYPAAVAVQSSESGGSVDVGRAGKSKPAGTLRKLATPSQATQERRRRRTGGPAAETAAADDEILSRMKVAVFNLSNSDESLACRLQSDLRASKATEAVLEDVHVTLLVKLGDAQGRGDLMKRDLEMQAAQKVEDDTKIEKVKKQIGDLTKQNATLQTT